MRSKLIRFIITDDGDQKYRVLDSLHDEEEIKGLTNQEIRQDLTVPIVSFEEYRIVCKRMHEIGFRWVYNSSEIAKDYIIGILIDLIRRREY